MASPATSLPAANKHHTKPRKSHLLDKRLRDSPVGRAGALIFGALMVVGVGYIASKLVHDLALTHETSLYPYVLLGLALLIALGFEFVNGFHDTANAVATVIYTHSLEPHVAVVWSGIWNFIGVLVSSGTVAYTIVALLPPELILRVSKGAGFSMVFALLVAAILWNLGTWWRGLPASSSHTMIGSVLGVGLAYQLMSGSHNSGLDWEQVVKVAKALFFSPLIGFGAAFLLLWLCRKLIKDPKFFEAPEGDDPPPFWMRGLLILTCTGVSYAHGQNDGQKGMGLIMLILVGTVPTAYALNHTVDPSSQTTFAAVSQQAAGSITHYIPQSITVGDSGSELTRFVETHAWTPSTTVALQTMVNTIGNEASDYGSLGNVPSGMQGNVRNQMYLTSETIRLMPKYGPSVSAPDARILGNYRTSFLDRSTQYIPSWVKVAVALALGLGTMIGWKRIVVTVGERIGKEHLTYAQGASAELVAMGTIMGATMFGLPVSTTHVLSSGVAGTMTANGSGLQWATIRNIILAWVLTLPAAAMLSGCLYWLFAHLAS